ncbi:MAG: DUF4956 domain-containing protein [Oscillospiraceae bacterium]|nr:DUF4956 domain-containing protein [Oscillospiraceae bacterium]
MNKTELFSYLTNSVGGYTVGEMLLNLAVAFVITLFIYLIYVATTKRVNLYSSFGLVLVLTSVVTAVIMMVIHSNLALSLGMVGALSIIRFRSAIKDPVDTSYIFWAVAAGLAAGTGNWLLAAVSSALIGIFVVAFSRLTRTKTRSLMVVRGSGFLPESIAAALEEQKIPYKVKSRSDEGSSREYIYELNREASDGLLSSVKALEGVASVNIVSGADV